MVEEGQVMRIDWVLEVVVVVLGGVGGGASGGVIMGNGKR